MIIAIRSNRGAREYRDFAIELLESIEPDRIQCLQSDGDANKALAKNYWNALKEVSK
jgi:hypothetical protein